MAASTPPSSESSTRRAKDLVEPSESMVGVPVRRTPVTPVPVGVRRGDDHGRRLDRAPVGTVDAGVLAWVDPAGLVQNVDSPWSLDWWVGAEDRWHHPSMETGTRQTPLGAAPVRETTLRVPGGEVVQRVGGVQAGAGPWSGPAVLVEVENRTGVPVALAVVLRPWELDSSGAISSVSFGSLQDPGGCVVKVDGAASVLLARAPARVVHGSRSATGALLAAGEDEIAIADMSWQAESDGDLEVALVIPLAHTAVTRILLPVLERLPTRAANGLRSHRRARRVRQRHRGGHVTVPELPWTAPPLESVANGWMIHAEHDARLMAPFEAWSDFVEWSANELRLAGPGEVTRCLDPTAPCLAGSGGGTRLGAVAEALAGIEAGEVHDAVSAALLQAQRFSGAVEVGDGTDATTALLWAGGAVLRGPRGSEHAEDLVGPLATAIQYLRDCTDGLDQCQIGGVGPRRSAGALRFVAGGLVIVGQPEVAEDALVLAGSLADETPVAPGDSNSCFDTAREERDLLASGDHDGLQRLAARLAQRRTDGVADVIGTAAKVGFDVAELAETRMALLDTMVADGPRGPRLLPVWPAEWAGRQLEAHRVSTAWGPVSFALRWHGSRPALLWEITPAVGSTDGGVAPVLCAPGIAPQWSGSGWSGEALLPEPGTVTPDGSSAGLAP